jgi:hypothetical protein
MVLPREVTGIDLAAVLGIDERSVRKLTTKNVLKRTALGYDLADTSPQISQRRARCRQVFRSASGQ